MGNPVFRFTLRHAETGSLEISEPIGWMDAKLKLERHEEYHSLIEYFEGAFIFYGNNGVDNGGIDFIRYVERNYGPDATIFIDVEVSFDSARTFETIFNGQLDLEEINELKDNRAQIPIIRDDFWAKFIARKSTPVNLQATRDLDDVVIHPLDNIYLNLPSQKIKKQFRGEAEFGAFIPQTDFPNGDFLQFDVDKDILDEIDEKYHLPIASNPERPAFLLYAEEAGTYDFDIRIECDIVDNIMGDNYATSAYVEMYIQFNDEAAIELTTTDYGPPLAESTVYEYIGSRDLIVGDVVRIYGMIVGNIFEVNDPSTASVTFRVLSAERDTTPSGGGDTQSNIRATHLYITGNTVSPATRDEAFLIHDVATSILKSYGLGVDNPFYSEHLGSPLTNGRVYNLYGCAWHYALIKGLHLRGYLLENKQFSISFDQWWNGANPIFNLSLTYDPQATTPDQQVIRVEKKNFCYTREISTTFDYVFEISRSYDQEKIFNKIEIGYNTWQSEDISGIDDPQTTHTYAARFKKIGQGTTVKSDFIAASLAIETTRRQTIIKSADYKFDNNTFIISINPDDVSPDAYTPELDENFSSITNLLNSDTRYNSPLTPGRNFKRWQNVFNGALQVYLTEPYKFVYGEGNYDMVSDLVTTCDAGGSLSEKQNISVTTDYLHLPLLYTIEMSLAWEDYVLIRDNRHKAIGISQTATNHKMFFIKSLEYQLVKGRATIQAWPVEYFEITQTDFTPTLVACVAAGACGTGESDRTTSEDEGRVTSEGECRTIA